MSLFDNIIQEIIGRFESAIIRSYNGYTSLDIDGYIINIWLLNGAIWINSEHSYDRFPLVSLDIDMVCEYIMNIKNSINTYSYVWRDGAGIIEINTGKL